MQLAETLLSLAQFIVGGAVGAGSAYLQQRWAATREDRRRDADERRERIQADRDVVADLIVALYAYASGVANLKLAYDATNRGGRVDVDRVREFQEAASAFSTALVRARVTVRNPAARPALDALHEQNVKMANHLNLAALGQPAPEFLADFREFRRIIGESQVALETAALTYDGTLSGESSPAIRST